MSNSIHLPCCTMFPRTAHQFGKRLQGGGHNPNTATTDPDPHTPPLMLHAYATNTKPRCNTTPLQLQHHYNYNTTIQHNNPPWRPRHAHWRQPNTEALSTVPPRPHTSSWKQSRPRRGLKAQNSAASNWFGPGSSCHRHASAARHFAAPQRSWDRSSWERQRP